MKRWNKFAAALTFSVLAAFSVTTTALAANEWKQEGEKWYYLDARDSKVTDKWMNINGKYYHFDSNGAMQSGWFYEDDDIYYLGDKADGYMRTGWRCLSYDEENQPEEGEISASSTPGDGTEWFYFNEKGKAVHADGSDEYKKQTIGDKKYYFDENGVMATGWSAVEDSQSDDATGISQFRYFGEDGNMAQGWKNLTIHPKDSDDSEELSGGDNDGPDTGDSVWYYFDSNGRPKYFPSNAKKLSDALAKVEGNSYFFDEYGCMQQGLIGFERGSETLCAYFGDNGDGKMRTGRQDGVRDDSGDTHTYYFSTSGSDKGAGYNGEKDDSLYYNGLLVKADSGSDYAVFKVADKMYLVNESGKVQTSNKCYKVDGHYEYEYDHGKIYYIDSDKERQGQVTSAESSLPSSTFEEPYSLN